MRNKLFIFLTIIVLMVSGSKISYAAFPTKAHNQSSVNATTGNGSQLVIQQSDEPSIKAASPAPVPPPASNNKSWIVALLLSFFLGDLGIHRFYLGYTWQGVVQLLTLGGFGIWAFIDFIRIIIKDLKPNGGNYDK